ncbi:hypothetical protein EUX98_g3036 [Antrodiella citrinella]|uniref:ADF-H domain-containing protein n=1 Tax=Antrodiella citrinella TaxID=2447956 RepID=A0A4S4N0A4_9APHY|nr:hypothetical protein EUX98_g3036 [Antrodiella citrinella]
MSATSGINTSEELTNAFGNAVDSGTVRFLKISIRNGSLLEDFDKLGEVLEDNEPAYILAKHDEASTWLAIFYVPDSAKVRDKMLYASTRNNLTKALGSTHFTDNLFATSKADVTADAYKKHIAHLNAPKPMSDWEKEMATIKAAEREAGGANYEGSRARRNPLGSSAMGFQWNEDAEIALKELAEGQDSHLVVLAIDPQENISLHSAIPGCSPAVLGSSLPASAPAFAFLAWPHNITSPPRREIVFIYSCPMSSPVKSRMLYSSGFLATYRAGKVVLGDAAQFLAERKIETSDPSELNEEFIKFELGLNTPVTSGTSTPLAKDDDKKAFARPKGPGRKR